MRLTAYLSTSRHGVFYFRWPIPATLHPERKRFSIRVAQADAPEKHVPAIVGHSQTGMTYNTYFKDGFLPAQLKVTIDLFYFQVARRMARENRYALQVERVGQNPDPVPETKGIDFSRLASGKQKPTLHAFF